MLSRMNITVVASGHGSAVVFDLDHGGDCGGRAASRLARGL
jgi:hypothetical protein